ncbi:hypothetical protein CL619_01050 [archaeon]|nr:hypothetical protein [archaeon]
MALREVRKYPSAVVVILTTDADIYDTVRKAKFYYRGTYPHWRRVSCFQYYESTGFKRAA